MRQATPPRPLASVPARCRATDAHDRVDRVAAGSPLTVIPPPSLLSKNPRRSIQTPSHHPSLCHRTPPPLPDVNPPSIAWNYLQQSAASWSVPRRRLGVLGDELLADGDGAVELKFPVVCGLQGGSGGPPLVRAGDGICARGRRAERAEDAALLHRNGGEGVVWGCV